MLFRGLVLALVLVLVLELLLVLVLYSFRNHYISATCMELKSGYLIGNTFTSRRGLLKRVRTSLRLFAKLAIGSLSYEPTTNLTRKTFESYAQLQTLTLFLAVHIRKIRHRELNVYIALCKNWLLRCS